MTAPQRRTAAVQPRTPSAERAARRLNTLARKWSYLVSTTADLPYTPDELEREVKVLVMGLFEAVASEPPDLTRATTAGARLVELRCVGEDSLNRSLQVLSAALVREPELQQVDRLTERVVSVLGALSSGYVRQLREELRRSPGNAAGELPDWRSPNLGSRVRIALWLTAEVGEGKSFSLKELRDAMPEVAEPARRLRDLRGAGWGLLSSREDPTLAPQELRFAQRGDPVWEKSYRSAGLRLLSSAMRNRVLERDGYRCVRCGVGAGETYPEEPNAAPARLVVNHIVALRDSGRDAESNLVTECTRCSQADSMRSASQPEQVWRSVQALPSKDRARVLAWLVKGGRDLTQAERTFVAAWRLPAEQREELKVQLAELVAG